MVRLFCIVAIGLSLGVASNRIEDEMSLLQGLSPVSVPSTVTQFSADEPEMLEKKAGSPTLLMSMLQGISRVAPPLALASFGGSALEVTLEKKPVPSTLAEFSSTAPNRYTHIGYDVEYHTFSEQLITFPMRKPRTFNLGMATCKTWLADLVVQLVERRAKGGSDGIDWRRNAAFAAFGFFYVGLVQWVLYVTVMTDLCPNAIAFSNEPLSVKLHNFPGQVDLVKQVVMDNFFFAVMIYFPVFYVVKEIVSGSRSPFADAMKKYKCNFLGDNAASMSFWIPGDIIAFAAPIFLRLPLDHCVSFIWTMYLSFKRGSSASATQAKGQ